MKRFLSLFAAVALMVTMVPAALGATSFTDIGNLTGAQRDAFLFCEEQGYIKGVTPTLGAPNDPLTRMQFAIVLSRVMDLREHFFKDIAKPYSWNDNIINILYANGVINGVSDDAFSTKMQATREMAATMIARAFKLVPDPDNLKAYEVYSDATSIQAWAREAVSACLRYDLLPFAPTDGKFNPQQVITRVEFAQIIYEICTYRVTVDVTGDGTVTPSSTKALPGTEITLTVKPGTGMQLVAGSLKANGVAVVDNKFTMPHDEVEVTAEFEEVPPVVPEVKVMKSIAVKTAPEDEYTADLAFDPTGLVIKVTYEDDTTADVAYAGNESKFTFDPNLTTALLTETEAVTITYTENGVSKSVEFPVTVEAS